MSKDNRVELLNRLFSGGNIAVLVGGLARASGPITLDIGVYLFFLLVLRTKFWFDDEQYIAEVGTGKLPGGLPYGFGMCLAFVSWFFWYLAGIFIKTIETSALFMCFVMGFSTLWIVAAMIKRGAYSEQVPWLFFNAFYIGGFVLLALRNRPWNLLSHHLQGYDLIVTGALLVVFLFDFIVTRLLESNRSPVTT